MKKNTVQFYIVYRKELEGGYTAIVPSLPGCVSYGKNLEQAQEMIQDAITGYIVSLKKHKEPISASDTEVVAGMMHLNGFNYA